MEPLNYCRQIAIQMQERKSFFDKWDQVWREQYGDDGPAPSETINRALNLSAKATKFLMPPGGVVIDDPDFRGLDGIENVSLPFDQIVIEMETEIPSTPKLVIVAYQNEFFIGVLAIYFYADKGLWIPALDDTCAISRLDPFGHGSGEPGQVEWSKSFFGNKTMSTGPVLCLMNALACSNVSVEKTEARPARKKAKRHAIGFDTYHCLMIKPAHAGKNGVGQASRDSRSVREHLRRGHIRRLDDGRRIWVNAAVVNAGIGAKVSKDYVVWAKETALNTIARPFRARR
jgi:hypothetical protein